jgi:ubiquinone/menaquinone biosynthesis C-methylase UbiE
MYRQLLGTPSTFRMQRWILPELAWNQETYGRRVLTTLKPRTRWLDLGCGQRLLCNGLENVEKELSSHRFVGVDLSLDNLRSQRHTKYRVLADGNRLPFKSESFDLITANMVVEHFQLPDLAFQEINRVLAPGGDGFDAHSQSRELLGVCEPGYIKGHPTQTARRSRRDKREENRR